MYIQYALVACSSGFVSACKQGDWELWVERYNRAKVCVALTNLEHYSLSGM
jgi:hypothetical protein